MRPRVCRRLSILVAVLGLVLVSACRRSEPSGPGTPIPAPVYPRYLLKTSANELMAAARLAVRQPYGRSPLGKMQSGQRAYCLIQYGQDKNVWEAIRQAWAERGVEGIALGAWELMGQTEAEYNAHVEQNLLHGDEAWQELGVFRPVYQPFFPPGVKFKEAYTSAVVRKDIIAFLDRRTDIQFLYAGTGGPWRTLLKHHGSKFQGLWLYAKRLDLLGKSTEFPGDLWNMVDDKIVKPISHVSEGSITDPEGTRLHWTTTPEQTKGWAKRTGASGHLNIYPPPAQATWSERTLRAEANHTGFYPTMTVTLSEHGRVDKIEGGGRVGEMFRMLVENPKMKNAKFPSAPESGYWFLTQDGFGTNPKFVRDVELLMSGAGNVGNLSERNRAGVQHFSFADPSRSDNPADAAYAKAAGLPIDHTAHMHVYFPTVRWKLADTGEWMTVSENGNVKVFDDPEVRALAAKYGDPNLIFRYEWIPSIPGVNVPGDHDRDYGADPWKWIMAEWKRIQSGSFERYVDDYTMQRAATPTTAQTDSQQ